MTEHLSSLSIKVTQAYPDGDQIISDYAMPVVIDSLNQDAASQIVAYYLNQMSLELKGLDRHIHRMQ